MSYLYYFVELYNMLKAIARFPVAAGASHFSHRLTSDRSAQVEVNYYLYKFIEFYLIVFHLSHS